jgi:hypothetical protein
MYSCLLIRMLVRMLAAALTGAAVGQLLIDQRPALRALAIGLAGARTTEPASPVSGWTRRAGLAPTTAALAPFGRPIIRSATAFCAP